MGDKQLFVEFMSEQMAGLPFLDFLYISTLLLMLNISVLNILISK